MSLKGRSVHGGELVVSDDHAELKKAIADVLTESARHRCTVHFLRKALDYAPRKADSDCLHELRWLYERRDLTEAQRDLAAWLAKRSPEHPQAHELGRRPLGDPSETPRRDTGLYLGPSGPPPASEEHEQDGTLKRGD